MILKKPYVHPSANVTVLSSIDVIATSGAVPEEAPDFTENGGGPSDLPWDH